MDLVLQPGGRYLISPSHDGGAKEPRWTDEAASESSSPPPPEQRPDLVQPILVFGSNVPVAATYPECFDVVRMVFIRAGTSGLAALFDNNGMAPQQRTVGAVDIEIDPEEILPADQLVLYRLLRAAEDRVHLLARVWVSRAQVAAAKEAMDRLRAGRTEIEAEVPRYLDGPGLAEGAALDERVPASLYAAKPRSADVNGLRSELRIAKALIAEGQRADRAAYDARGRVITDTLRSLPFFTAYDPQGQARIVDAALAADPSVRQAEAAIREARNQLLEHVATAGLAFPVLHRIYRSADPAASDAVLGRAIVDALRTAYTANTRAYGALAGDAEDVWDYAPSVREALWALDVPEMSIARTAVEQRLGKQDQPRLAAQLGITSGLAAGAIGLAPALAATPLGVAVVAVDALINVIDAVQEYLAYRRRRAGFDAVLDPELAPGNEPDLLSSILTIAFDLAAALPVPGARGAGTVP